MPSAAGTKMSFLKCPEAEGGHPKVLSTPEMMELLLSSCFAGSHHSVLVLPMDPYQPQGTDGFVALGQ